VRRAGKVDADEALTEESAWRFFAWLKDRRTVVIILDAVVFTRGETDDVVGDDRDVDCEQ
jgi:hypothetical protein